MKTIITSIVATIISSIILVSCDTKNHSEKYCTKIEDGKKVIMHKGNPLTVDVTLSNGTKIQTDGTILKTDGTSIIMKEGECIDNNSVIDEEKDKKQQIFRLP